MSRLLAAVLTAVVVLALPEASAAAAKACDRVRNPYPGTRYEGADLTRIRAAGVSCSWARKVAKRAHRKALAMPLPADGIRRLKWRGWSVTGDLRPETDRYVARKGDRRVRWRF